LKQPVVTVICLCFNQANFVIEAIKSVLEQSYSNIEMIVVDDASTDGSQTIIQNFCKDLDDIKLIMLNKNLGNCKAFNKALALSSGEYIVDFAADDLMLPQRIESQVKFFSQLPHDYGVVFHDAEYIDHKGKTLFHHFSGLRPKIRIKKIPQGMIYGNLVEKFLIAAPTMMIKHKVLKDLMGYDENLAYEDFDFWVRSSRNWKYAYQNEVLTKIRLLKNSLSRNPEKKKTIQGSTFLVCEKVFALNQSKKEDFALLRRLATQTKEATVALDWANSFKYTQLFLKAMTRKHFRN